MLGFGIKMASNVAQRLADLIVFAFNRKMDAVDGDAVGRLRSANQGFEEWYQHRLAIGAAKTQAQQDLESDLAQAMVTGDVQAREGAGKALAGFHLLRRHQRPTDQCRLYTMLMYTDDPAVVIVGADRVVRALKVWHWFTNGGNFMMAIAEKRSLGTSAYWTGVKYLTSLGLCIVTAPKVLRAVSGIDRACSQSMPFDEYRRLVGFLEHVRDVLFLRGNKMYGLYRPHQHRAGPADLVVITSLMAAQLQAWKNRLLLEPGAALTNIEAFLSGTKITHAVESAEYAPHRG